MHYYNMFKNVFQALMKEFVKECNDDGAQLDVNALTTAALGVLDRKCRNLRMWLLEGETKVLEVGSKRMKATIPRAEYHFGFRGPKDFVVPCSNSATWTAPILVAIRNGRKPGNLEKEEWKAGLRSFFMVMTVYPFALCFYCIETQNGSMCSMLVAITTKEMTECSNSCGKTLTSTETE